MSGAAEIAAGQVPPLCAGMAMNCAHYTGGCDQPNCLALRAILERENGERGEPWGG